MGLASRIGAFAAIVSLGLGQALSGQALIGEVLAADLSPRPAPAPLAPVFQSQSLISELRLGVFAHDPWSPEKGGADLNAEILFAKPFQSVDPVWSLLIPRPHIGATVNFEGKTSNAYAGFTWSYDITPKIFIEASFGGAVNNGETGFIVPRGRVAMGCNWSFRESASIGYRFAANWSILATVEHFSNAGLCDQNRGLTNVGARLAYTF